MATEPFLFVGLGNPGAKYSGTRHNLGFEALDSLASKHGAAFSSKFQGQLAEIRLSGHKIYLLKPETFMNLSGRSVLEAVSFFKIPAESHLVVVSDDLDLPPGALRLREKGGPGGHNGLKSIIEVLGSELFPRIRMGIGRSAQIPADQYVLMKIPKAEAEIFQKAVTEAALALETVALEGFSAAMNRHNIRPSKETKTNEP